MNKIKKLILECRSIEMYDEYGNLLKRLERESTYRKVDRIIVHNEKEFKSLRDFAIRSGISVYGEICGVGTWVNDEDGFFTNITRYTFDKFLSDKYVNKLIELQDSDKKLSNNILTELLMELGYSEVVNEYKKIKKTITHNLTINEEGK